MYHLVSNEFIEFIFLIQIMKLITYFVVFFLNAHVYK